MKKWLILLFLGVLVLHIPIYSASSQTETTWPVVLELRADSENFRYAPQWSPNKNLLIVYDWLPLPTQVHGKQTQNSLWGYRIYDVQTGERLPQFGDLAYDNLEWSSQGNYVTHIATAHNAQINRDYYFVEIIDVATGHTIAETGGYAHEITRVVWHPSEKYVAVSSEDGTRVWDTEGNLFFELNGTVEDDGQPKFHSWHPDGTLFAYSEDDLIRIASFDNPNTPLLTLYKITGQLAWHPFEAIVAVSSDYKIQVWDIETGQLLQTLMSIKAPLSQIRWHPKGLYLATFGEDGWVALQAPFVIWDSETFETISEFPPHDHALPQWGWNKTGKRFLSVDLGSARVFDALGANMLLEIEYQFPRNSTLSPDGTLLAEAFQISFDDEEVDTSIRIWGVDSGTLATRLIKPPGFARDLIWSADSQYLFAQCEDGMLRVWRRE